MSKVLRISKLFVFGLIILTLLLMNGSRFSMGDAKVYLYVHNKLYKGEIQQIGNRLYADLEALLKLLKVKYLKEGSNYFISSEGEVSTVSRPTALVYVNGQPFKSAFIKGSKVMVDVKALAEALGFRFFYNPDTGIADVVKLRKITYTKGKAKGSMEETKAEKSSGETVSEASEGKGTSEEKGESSNTTGKTKKLTAEEKEKAKQEMKVPADAVKVIKLDRYYDFNSKQLSLKVVVANTWKKPVKNVVVTLRIVDGRGKDILKKVYSFGTLKPGQKKEISYFWINYTGVYNPAVKVDIDFKGKKKAKK